MSTGEKNDKDVTLLIRYYTRQKENCVLTTPLLVLWAFS